MAEIGVEQTQQNMNGFKTPAIAVAAGIGGALIIATLPHVFLENIIGTAGISEIIPAAAPPLGNTARGLVAIMAGLVSASAIYLFLNYKRGSDMGVALREKINAAHPVEMGLNEQAVAKKSRFALPKLSAKSLTKFLKKPKTDKARVMDLADLPQLRKLDSESDIAERPSIFSAPKKSPENQPPLSEAIQPSENAAPVEPLQTDIPVTSEAIAEQSHPAPAAELPTENLSDLNIAQLTDRLESSLRRLKQLEAASFAVADLSSELPVDAMPTQPAEVAAAVAAPINEAFVTAPPPLKEVEKSPEDIAVAHQADMDAALKAALGTLEKMTAQR
ncbi:MAG: hypothetical protein V7676_05285 [Parasphingorhabdus sp.]